MTAKELAIVVRQRIRRKGFMGEEELINSMYAEANNLGVTLERCLKVDNPKYTLYINDVLEHIPCQDIEKTKHRIWKTKPPHVWEGNLYCFRFQDD